MSTTAPEDVAWDLEPLVDGEGEAGVDRQLDEADARPPPSQQAYAGKVAELDGPGLAAAIAELAEDRRARRPRRLLRLAALQRATPPTRPTARCSQRVQERGTAIETKLLFFDLEWAALDDARADELLAADGLEQAPPPPAPRCAATARTC